MSSFLVSREWDNRNRWRDEQACPDVGQGIMAPWARRPGCVLVCYAQIGRGRPRETRRGRGALPWMEKKKKPCPGSRELEGRALFGNVLRESPDWRQLEESAKEIGVERKERR
ncbi:hypothetical protein TNCV_1720481 [Trichonephila clavipes]|nr:hypothetical protein TNCV_1720481 [Trichonephila clavipes]